MAPHGAFWLPLAWCTDRQRCQLKQGSFSQARNSALLK
jgi:hypothetical protein